MTPSQSRRHHSPRSNKWCGSRFCRPGAEGFSAFGGGGFFYFHRGGMPTAGKRTDLSSLRSVGGGAGLPAFGGRRFRRSGRMRRDGNGDSSAEGRLSPEAGGGRRAGPSGSGLRRGRGLARPRRLSGRLWAADSAGTHPHSSFSLYRAGENRR